jgi:hypothetical protein
MFKEHQLMKGMSDARKEFLDEIRKSWADHNQKEGETREERWERIRREMDLQPKLQAQALYKLLKHKDAIDILISIIDKRD